MNFKEKVRKNINKGKIQLAMSFAVAATGVFFPDISKSDCNYAGEDLGDCELSTMPFSEYVCTEGSFWNDCE